LDYRPTPLTSLIVTRQFHSILIRPIHITKLYSVQNLKPAIKV